MWPKIGFLGIGKMAQALLSAIPKNAKKSIFIYDPIKKDLDISPDPYWCQSAIELEEKADIIVLCTKPQDLSLALDGYKGNKKYISIIAGLSTEKLSLGLRTSLENISRVMPNLGLKVAHSVNAIYCKNEDLFHLTKKLLEKTGLCIRIFNEEKLHAITALSGSGPAYVASFIEGLTKAGQNIGLEKKEAEILALETIQGTIYLVQKKQMSPSQICAEVSSPDGTTVAGLEVLSKKDFSKILEETLEASKKRSIELCDY